MSEIRTVDLFCGAGGSSWGARKAGAKIVAAFDLWDVAGKVHQENFPEAQFFNTRIEEFTDAQIRALAPINLIIASPECTNHTHAKGNKPRSEKSRETAFQVLRFAKILNPRWIVIENVVNMQNWSRFKEFMDTLHTLGYQTRTQTLVAADFGVPTGRRRMFILCDREREPAEIRPRKAKHVPASKVIDQNGTYRYSDLYAPCRAEATLARAKNAIAVLGKRKPFLLVYYGSDQAGGWQPISKPLRTITTLDRFALVKPVGDGYHMRMLQVPELKGAMGMPKSFVFNHGTRRDQVKMIGNAVCPPLMTAAIRSLSKL